ncbi:MAG: TolC family protein [Elusimicrobia bacterium]|nr:TolC family protein [Elusimicrobiota bacterium]
MGLDTSHRFADRRRALRAAVRRARRTARTLACSFHLALAQLFAAMNVASQESESRPAAETFTLSLERFVELAFRNSLRARTYRNSVASEQLGFQAGWRTSRQPRVNLTSSGDRSYTSTTQIGEGGTPDSTSNTYGTATSVDGTLASPLFWTGGSLSLSASQSRSLSNTAGTVSTSETTPRWGASYTQPLFIFTGDMGRRSWRRTLLGRQNSVESLRREQLSIWSEARSLYYQTLQQRRAMAVEEQSLKSSRQLLRATRELTRAGRYAPVELGRAELRYARDARRVKSAETELEKHYNRVRTFLQLPHGAQVVLTSKLQYAPFRWGLDDLASYALSNRQDYLSAQRSIETAQLAIKDLKESNRPALSLVSSYSNSRMLSNIGADSRSHAWTLQVLATWLLFDSGVTRLGVRKAYRDLDSTTIALENVRQQVRVEVENSFLNIKNLEAQLRDFEANRKLASKNLEAVRYRYRNGLDRLIDVFDAENEMRSLELEHLNLLVSYQTSVDQMALTINGHLAEVTR